MSSAAGDQGSGDPGGGERVGGDSRELADRADWAGLWRLAQKLPVIEAVAALRLIDGRWRPDAGADQALLSRLARVRPDVLTEGRGALQPGGDTAIGEPTACCFSADGRTAVVAVRPPSSPERMTSPTYGGASSVGPTPSRYGYWNVFELPGGTPAGRCGHVYPDTSSMAFAGGTVFGTARRRLTARTAQQQRSRLLRWEPGRRVRALDRLVHRAEVFAGPEGFVLAHTKDGQTWLRFHGADQSVTREVALTVGRPGEDAWPLAVDPVSGRLAVAALRPAAAGRDGAASFAPPTARLLLVDRDGSRVLAASPADMAFGYPHAWFQAEDRLITTRGKDGINVWGVVGDTLESLASGHPAAFAAVPSATGARIAVVDVEDGALKSWYLDPVTLAPIAELAKPCYVLGGGLWRSPLPDGPLVLGEPWHVTIIPPAAEAAAVAARPPVSWVPADLAAVASVAGRPAATPAAAELLSVLHDWLRHRLGPVPPAAVIR